MEKQLARVESAEQRPFVLRRMLQPAVVVFESLTEVKTNALLKTHVVQAFDLHLAHPVVVQKFDRGGAILRVCLQTLLKEVFGASGEEAPIRTVQQILNIETVDVGSALILQISVVRCFASVGHSSGEEESHQHSKAPDVALAVNLREVSLVAAIDKLVNLRRRERVGFLVEQVLVLLRTGKYLGVVEPD